MCQLLKGAVLNKSTKFWSVVRSQVSFAIAAIRKRLLKVLTHQILKLAQSVSFEYAVWNYLLHKYTLTFWALCFVTSIMRRHQRNLNITFILKTTPHKIHWRLSAHILDIDNLCNVTGEGANWTESLITVKWSS